MPEQCKDKVREAFESRMEDIRKMYEAGYWIGDEDIDEGMKEELPGLADYGLCIDYVENGTFEDQEKGYYRYQLSYGGPTEEFRMYENGDIEFWYLDWFDGASTDVTGEDADIIEEIIKMSGITEREESSEKDFSEMVAQAVIDYHMKKDTNEE